MRAHIPSLEDKFEIQDVIARYAHIVDNPGTVERLHFVFADTIVLEAPAFGRVSGLEAVSGIYAAVAGQPRPDHHTQQAIITDVDDGRVRTRSHFIAVWPDGRTSSGDYLDVLEHTDAGWRIMERTIVNRLPAPDLPEPPDVYVGWEVA